jgi:hypothetical protein
VVENLGKRILTATGSDFVVTFDEALGTHSFSRERVSGFPIGGGSGGRVAATPKERRRDSRIPTGMTLIRAG